MRKLLAPLVVMALSLSPVQAEEKVMDFADFIVDADGLVGKVVTLECNLSGSASSVFCRASNGAGSVIINGRKFKSKEDYRRVLKGCPLFQEAPGCHVVVTGKVVRGSFDVFYLEGVTVTWSSVEGQKYDS